MNKLKEKAFELRQKGYSYNIINEKIGISKSTLSYWFRNEPPVKHNDIVKNRIATGPRKVGQIRHEQKIKSIIDANKLAFTEIGAITKRDLQMFGAGLYLGEGTKSLEMVRFTNADPASVKMMVLWLSEVCLVQRKSLRISIHAYPDSDINILKKFWSRYLNIPLAQFGKTQIDKRSGKKTKNTSKLAYGTVQLSVRADGIPTQGVALHRKIMGWISAVQKQTINV